MSGSCNHLHNHFDFSEIQNSRLKSRVMWASVCVALTLVLSKVIAWYLTGSISILSSLTDSFLDFFASVVSFIAVRQAMKPADEQHRYGFGKAEALAALAQSIFIILSVSYVAYEAVLHLQDPKPITKPFVGIVVMIISIVLTLFLVRFQTYVIKKTRSVAIHADSAHYKADLYLNLTVLVSIILSYYFSLFWVDGVMGLAVASYILYTSYGIAKHSINILMDRELPTRMKNKIVEIIKKNPEVKGLHELKTRSSGTRDFVQVHVEMDGDISLKKAHEISYEIERELLAAFPRIHLTIHQDPDGVDESHVKL